MEKTCRQCSQEKPLTDFYAHKRMADGFLHVCKECHKSNIRKARSARIDYYRAYDRKRAKNSERIKAAKEHVARWRHEDSRRVSAHNAVARAIKSGRLARMPCSRCGCEQSLAHHESYDKKLDVIWLCQPCHKKRHKEMAIQGIEP